MTLGDRVLTVLGVQRDEARLVWRMLLLYLVLIGALVLIQSMAFGLFIAEFGSERLPYAYLAIAGLASVVSFAYLRLAARVSFQRLLTANLAFLASGSLVLWLGLRSSLGEAATFLLPVWFQIFVTLANLVVWPLAMRLFDVRQGKRVFGLIGAGNWVANMLGGLVVAPLVAVLGPVDLLALAAVVVVGAWLLLRGIMRDYLPPVAAETSGKAAEARAKTPLGAYAWRIFAYTAAWWLAFYFVDNLFYAQAGAQYQNAESLTAFIGRFLSVTGAVALFTSIISAERARAERVTDDAIVAFLLFAIWPFTRLVHVFSAPVGYLWRPYVVYRSRPGAQFGNRPYRRGWSREDVGPESRKVGSHRR